MRNMRGAISMRELYAVGLLLACLILLLSHHSAALVRLANQTGVTAAPTVEPVAAPASMVASEEARRAFKQARELRLEHDLAMMQPMMQKWSALVNGSGVTEGKDQRITSMQDVRQQLGSLVLSSQCAVDAQQADGDAMDASITYFIAKSRNWTNASDALQQAAIKAEAAKQASVSCGV